jgi:arsenite methyltransferase
LTKYIDNHLYKEKKMATQTPTSIHKAVQEHYGNLAKEAGPCCEITGGAQEKNVLYPAELLTGLPADIANFTAGSGDPITLAKLQPGETVLDLGSGAGLDCFLAARQVGERGHVIGVDMTPDMLARARSNADRLQVRNVEFREGFLESLPVEDASVDVVISNCVINLSPDKPQVLREMFRVLKPGGRIAVSDIVTNRPLPEKSLKGNEDWCGCQSGALAYQDYSNELGKVGFVDIRLEPNMAMVENAIDSGHVKIQANKKPSKEEILERIRNWDKFEGNMFIPYKITASKPA